MMRDRLVGGVSLVTLVGLLVLSVGVTLSSQVCMAANPILSIDFSGTETEIVSQPGDDTPLQPGYVGWAGPYFGNPGSDYNETKTSWPTSE